MPYFISPNRISRTRVVLPAILSLGIGLLCVQNGFSQKTVRERAARQAAQQLRKAAVAVQNKAVGKPGGKVPAEMVIAASIRRQGGTVTLEKQQIVEVALSPNASTDATLITLSKLKHIQKLDLTRCSQISNTGLAALNSLKSLRELKLGHCSRLTNVGMDHLKGLTNLTHLDLTYCRGIDAAGIQKLTPLTKLRELRLGQLSRLKDNGLVPLKAFPELTVLDLSYCRGLTDAGFKHLASLKKLETLDLSHAYVSDLGLKSLAELANLKSLDLGYCTRYTVAGLKAIANGKPRLKVLALLQNRGVKDDALKIVSTIGTLEELDLDSTGVTIAGLAHLKALPKLKTLRVSSLGIDDKGIAHIAKLKTIEELRLYNTSGLTDAGLEKLTALPALKLLDLGFCKGISNNGMKHVGKLKKLESLTLRSTNINDGGLKFLKDLTNITELNLAYCRTVTSAGVANLTGMKKMQKLDLSFTAMNTTGLNTIGGMTELRELNLHSCRSVSNLSKLSKLTKMETLNLSYCQASSVLPLSNMKKLKDLKLYGTRVTDRAATRLAQLKSLQKVDLQRTQLTANGFRQIRAALPGARVTGSPMVVTRTVTIRGNEPGVKIYVKGRFTNTEKRALLERLKTAAGIDLFSYYIIADHEKGTLFEISPVTDPEKFAQQLVKSKIAGKPKGDASSREFHIELLPQAAAKAKP